MYYYVLLYYAVPIRGERSRRIFVLTLNGVDIILLLKITMYNVRLAYNIAILTGTGYPMYYILLYILPTIVRRLT